MLKRLLIALIVLLGITASAQAQVVINPTGVSFTPSTDHNATINVNGTQVAMVSGYRLETYVFTTVLGTLVFNKDLGKPTPDGTNTILIKPLGTPNPFTALAQGSYTAKLYAYGPGGDSIAATSDPFAKVNPPAAPGKPIPQP